MIDLIKLWWHCLVRTMNFKEDHRMCAQYHEHEDSGGAMCRHVERRFCTCGYAP